MTILKLDSFFKPKCQAFPTWLLDPLREGQSDVTDKIINLACKRLINEKIEDLADVRFSEVKTDQEWNQIFDLRVKVYQSTNPYMLNELTAGKDSDEERSSVYAVWFKDVPIATIRLTPYPFETLKYVEEKQLGAFLGEDYKENYLEWTRLLVDHDFKIPHVMPALLAYAGMKVLTGSGHQKYLGYTKPIIRRLMKKFNIDSETLEFTIPSRENNRYLLLKGDFYNDFNALANKCFLL